MPPKRIRTSTRTSDDEESQEATARAEKCRELAKKRRDQEGELLAKLASLLPFPESITSKLDKGSILRLTVYYLRMKKYSQTDGTALLNELQSSFNHRNGTDASTNGAKHSAKAFQGREGDLMLRSMNGFLIFVCRYGNIYYVSPHVEEVLGMKMEQMIGHNILEFAHPDDQREIAKQFCEQRPPGARCLVAPLDPNWDCMSDEAAELEDLDLNTFVRERLFYVRLKCYIQKQGQRTRQASYVMLQWSGRLKLKPSQKKHCGFTILGLVAICRPMETRSVLEVRLDGNMFTSHHDLSMKFVFCDPRIITLVGYQPHEVVGKTAYQFHNPLDAPKIHSCHSNLIKKGRSTSRYYRFISKEGDWIWMQTRANIVYNAGNSPMYVSCLNWIIREEEGRRALMMEQEEQGVRDENARGMIELTAGSPAPSLSTATSGYSSCDDCSGPTSPEVNAMCQVTIQKQQQQQGGGGGSDVVARVLPADNKAPARHATHNWLGDFDLTVFSDLGAGSEELVGQPQVAAPVVSSSTPGGMADLRDVRTVTNLLNGPSTGSPAPPVGQWDSVLDPGVEMMDVDVDTDDNTDHRQLLVSMMNRNHGGGDMAAAAGGAGTDLIEPAPLGAGSMSLSLDAFPPAGLMATDSITDDLAFKFSDNVLSQQINESLFKFLGEMDPMSSSLSLESLTDMGTGGSGSLTDNLLNDVNMCTTAQPLVRPTSPLLCTAPPSSSQASILASTPPPPSLMSSAVNDLGTSPAVVSELPSLLLQSPLRGSTSSSSSGVGSMSSPSSSTSPQQPSSAAVFRGLDDHSYTNKTGPSPGHHHHNQRSQKPCASLLEHFLTTKSRLNPQKGSDYIIAQEAMSALKLGDQRGSGNAGNGNNAHNSNLLKQLLTGEMDKHSARTASAAGARSSRSSATDSSMSPLDSPPGDLELLSPWSPNPPPPPPSRRHSHRQVSTELQWSNEVDEILHEQMRQEDAWMQQYFPADLL